MGEVTQITGLTVALPIDGLDTDQIIPARFMSRSRDDGYGNQLFYDLRRDGPGNLLPDFPLNASEADDANILLAGRNFGNGSSREAAVYALLDGGFRAVVAPSFGDIFLGNAVNNGLVPARVSEDVVDTLLHLARQAPLHLSIDLEVGRLAAPGLATTFSLDATSRHKLCNGWDDIDMSLAQIDTIRSFARQYETTWPWTTL
ncbi:MAG: 3-isopropylmalate dehydratase small subunit [Pseudomonadota bacterium]